ncbi:MAG: hypothetical protein ACK559_24000, partial [bacterium]
GAGLAVDGGALAVADDGREAGEQPVDLRLHRLRQRPPCLRLRGERAVVVGGRSELGELVAGAALGGEHPVLRVVEERVRHLPLLGVEADRRDRRLPVLARHHRVRGARGAERE